MLLVIFIILFTKLILMFILLKNFVIMIAIKHNSMNLIKKKKKNQYEIFFISLTFVIKILIKSTKQNKKV